MNLRYKLKKKRRRKKAKVKAFYRGVSRKFDCIFSWIKKDYASASHKNAATYRHINTNTNNKTIVNILL